MFVLLPAADTEYREWSIDGVAVRALAYPAVNLTEAKARLESWLPELRRRFGPFPTLHGLSLFLYNDAGGGMEYYGGTITSLSALRHEVVHSYFGCSVVARTYPDSWYDEAVTSWFEETMRGQGHTALPHPTGATGSVPDHPSRSGSARWRIPTAPRSCRPSRIASEVPIR